jgi:quercetin dioxygenase-like cupin family protein
LEAPSPGDADRAKYRAGAGQVRGKAMTRNFVICLAALLTTTAAEAQVNPANLKWGPAPPGLPAGARVAVLSGNPEKAGTFTIRIRFPKGYRVPPHHHPSDELVTVISGQMALGMGNTFNRGKMKTLVQGGYAVAAKDMNHYVFSPTGGIVQITSQGPFQIIYVNPADDPRKRK